MDDSTQAHRRARLAAPATLATAVFLWIPYGIHARNAVELGFDFVDVLPILLTASATSFAALLWLGSAFKTPSRRNGWLVALNLVAGLAWAQYALIGWNYGPLDGRSVHWTSMALKGVVDASSWLIVLAVGISFAHRVPPRAILWLSGCLLTTFTLSSALAWQLGRSGSAPQGDAYALDASKTYRFSSTRNVIVVLWDEFQANQVLELLDENRHLRNQLDGFKLYQNALGGYKATLPSIPYLLSGEMYDNSAPFGAFRERALRYGSAPSLLKGEGYLTDLVPWYPGTLQPSPEIQDNLVLESGSLARHVRGAVRLLELAIFSASPHFLKGVTYSRGEWYLSGILRSWGGYASLTGLGEVRATDVEIAGTSNDRDLLVLREMARGIHLATDQPVFKFYHFRGAHTPFNVDRNGQRVDPAMDLDHYREMLEFKLYLMTKLIEILKEAGIYDNSLIVFAGDHGSGRSADARAFRHPHTGHALPANLEVKARATPLLAVKFPGDRGRPRVSQQPVSLGDVNRMILLGEDGFVEARTGDEVRRYVEYTWSESFSDYLEDFREYVVTGHPWLDEAWTPYHFHPEAFDPADCFFNRSRNRALLARDSYGSALPPGGSLEIELPEHQRSLFALIQLEALGDERHPIRLTQGSQTLFEGRLRQAGEFRESIGVAVPVREGPLRLSFASRAEDAELTLDHVVWIAYDPCSGLGCTTPMQPPPRAETRSASVR